MTERSFEIEPEGTPPPPQTPPAPPRPPFPPPARARRGEREPRPSRGRRALVIFLLANALPVAGLVYFASLSEERRRAIVDAIPSGVGGRAIVAGIAFVALLVLARLVLPAARSALGFLAVALDWFRRRPAAQRTLLYPAEAGTYLAWFLVQILFALDAVAILGTAAVFLMYVVRILKPDWFTFLPG